MLQSNTLNQFDEHCAQMERCIRFLEESLLRAQKENIALLNSQTKHNEAMMGNLLLVTLKTL